MIRSLFVVLLTLSVCTATIAQTTAFTYQGKLANGGTPATGNYDFEFRLFDALSNGTQQGTTQTLTNVAVAGGIFTVQLDFGQCGSCFNGAARFLEISVRVTGGGSFTLLTPRQSITSMPYAMKTSNLAFNGPLNDGTIVFAASNTFAGEGTATSTTPSPALNSSSGKLNAFFGAGAGQQNTSGSLNAFFGAQAGQHNGSGCCNAFFGYQAGQLSTSTDNAYFGFQAGQNNILGTENAFFGNGAGLSLIGGTGNTIIGTFADFNTSNSAGNFTTLLGFSARANNGVNNGSAIGFRALVSQNNSLVLGSINGVNGATADTNVGIGTTAPTERLHIVGNGLFTGNLTATQFSIVSPTLGTGVRLVGISGTGDTNTFLGRNAAAANPTGNFNSFFGNGAGQSTVGGSNNSFFGSGAGTANVGGSDNAFFGRNAGTFNTANDNAFFGSFAGASNTNGNVNAFFGKEAGRNNSGGSENVFVGHQAGQANTIGSSNAFFGTEAGKNNLEAGDNSFFGTRAGIANVDGASNAFFGSLAGADNTHGTANSCFGAGAGHSNQNGSFNTFIGNSTDFRFENFNGKYNTALGYFATLFNEVTNSTAIGAFAFASQSNSLVLGGISGLNNATADTNVGIGTTAPAARLEIVNSTTDASSNTAIFSAPNLGGNFSHIHFGATGDWYIRSAAATGKVVLQDTGGNVGIGIAIPATKLHVSGTGIIRARVDSDSNAGLALTLSNQPKWSVATTAPGNFLIFNDGIGQNAFSIDSATNVISITALGAAGGSQLCRNASNQISSCSSSLRYKNNIAPLHTGSQIINQLRSVTFDWKQSGEHDLGLVAEEVAKVEPLLVTRNDKGEIEGVKYDRIGVLLINVVKEQQTEIASQQIQIENQQRLIEQQQHQLDILKKLVCSSHRKNKDCK